MDEEKTIQKAFLYLYLHEAETYQKLAKVSGILSVGMIPSMLILAGFAPNAGGNGPDVFRMLGVFEICCFLAFGISVVMGKRCRKKANEYAALLSDEETVTITAPDKAVQFGYSGKVTIDEVQNMED